MIDAEKFHSNILIIASTLIDPETGKSMMQMHLTEGLNMIGK